jgi:two-component system nitrogen regulation response regulator GlnG
VARLLVIDDEASVCYSFRRVFGARGIEVSTAATAKAGLDSVRANRPDVIVLDLQLPDRSGMEVYQAIRKRDARLPVIFMTAHGTKDTAIEAMKQGAFDYLVKPVDFDHLSQVISRALEAAQVLCVPALLPYRKPSASKVARGP